MTFIYYKKKKVFDIFFKFLLENFEKLVII